MHTIAGCLVAEPIKKAYKILSSSMDKELEESGPKEARPNLTTLQFGEVTFQREVKTKGPPSIGSEALEGKVNGAILCEEEAVAALCGIRAIWVSPCNRRKHIASHLLDAAR
ncbi:hypothetical protein U1Q18_013942 [Sarracenia purpurea var. burkii]